MKKLTAILLLLLLLFNLVGYRLWFYYAQQQADAKLVASLDKETYNEDDLITLKVPLSLPYQTDWKDFERVDGEISFGGKIYKFVKRKVQHGELVLLCLPNHQKAQLETAKDEFFKLANSLQAGTPVKKPVSSSTVSVNNVLSDYDSQCYQDWSMHTYTNQLKHAYPVNENSSITPFLKILEQPPESHKI